jgi:serine/threonine protein kinase
LKVVHPAFAGHQPYMLQTLREACILEAVAHPGVPIVYESGVLRDRRPWFAFEQVSGPTLEELLAQGPLDAAEVAAMLRDLADLLEHVHRRGVIHRGIRPDRIVVTSERRFPLCVPDWSEAIAHDASAEPPHVAPDGSGSYRAPELASQLAGDGHGAIDDRADMFALGVIGYRALTGAMPGADHVAARHRAPAAPAELTALIDSLLAFDRFDRPSASEVRADLDWLFEAVPEVLGRPSARDSEPSWARARTQPRGLEAAAAQAMGTGPLAAPTSAVEAPRTRRPRWTPEAAYADAGPGEAPAEAVLTQPPRAPR